MKASVARADALRGDMRGLLYGVTKRVAARFEERFGVELVAGGLTEDETERAVRLRAWRYLSEAWTLERREPGRRSAGRVR